MKKMFSTGVKQSLLGGAMRRMFIALLLFNATAAVAGTDYYAKFTAKVADTGGGKVYVDQQKNEPAEAKYQQPEFTKNTTSKSEEQKAYLYAMSEPGYYFVDWRESTNLGKVYSTIAKGEEVTVNASASADNPSNRVDGGTYVAFFAPVLVNRGTPASIQVNDIYVAENSLTTAHTKTGVVAFSVTGADNIEDFYTPTIAEVDGFSYQGMEYANGVLSVTIQYQDQNIDNVNPGYNPPLQTTVTLRSKGDTDGSKTRSAEVSAYSSLMPDFVINPSEGKSFIDLTPNTPMSNDVTLTASFAKVLDGAASTPTAINVSPKNNVANAGQWSLSFKDAADAANKGFSISGDQVSFKPTEAYKNTVDISTVLYVQCTYKDNQNKEISQVKEITISADAGGIITIENEEDGLMLENATMVFDVDYGTSGESVTKTLAFMTTLPGVTQAFSAGFPTEYITSTLQDPATKLSISIKNTLPIGQYNHTITFTSSGVSATLNLIVNVRLAKPILTATTGIGQAIQLDWQAIEGATYYILKDGETTMTTIPAGESTTYYIDQYNGQTLSTTKEFNFTVTAVYEPNPYGTRVSDIVTVKPSMPTNLTQGNVSGLKIYTGTDKTGDFPYKAKQLVDLRHIFDTEGNALFDELYIFGLTTNTSGGIDLNLPDASTPCNASTPLYIYTKNALGKSYDFSQAIDAAATRFDHGSKKDKKLYFTGYCPFAYMGTNLTHEGWMYFRGGNERVDLYLENCDIRGRYKTPTGVNSGYNDRLVLNVGPNYMTGSSSIFVFNSTSTDLDEPYKPSIHIRGNNHLKGQGGFLAHVDIYVKVLFIEYNKPDFLKNVPIISAPISIKPDKNNGYTNLIMDDVWPAGDDKTEITNGYLRLDSYTVSGEKAERGLCVDLGTKYGSLTINGGQYHLRNSAADYNYTCNMAIAAREYVGDLGALSPSLAGIEAATLYGFGSDVGTPKLVINSGTFTMEKNVYIDQRDGTVTGATYYLDQDNFLDLRLPYGEGKSRINGGTYNGISNVLMCSNIMSSGQSPTNAQDYWLCLQDVEVDPENTTSNGSVIFEVPAPFSKAYEAADPIFDISESASLNSVVTASYYGAQSVNSYEKDDKFFVRLLLPGDDDCESDCESCERIDEAINYNWVTVPPEISIDIDGLPATIQGETEVPTAPDGVNIEYKVNNMVFGDMDGLQGYDATIGLGASVKLAKDYTIGEVTNVEPYTIQKNINFVKTVEADRWYCFVAPFDIHEVMVLEIGEDLTSYQNDDNPNNRNTAKEKQAISNLRIWETLYYAIYPQKGRASGRTLLQVLGGSVNAIPLEHYNGGNISTAHYYLYKLESDEFSTDATGEKLNISWVPVPDPEKGKPLFKKGQTYAMQFPYCPMCNDLAERKYYDYWTNKYVLFYGKGPQEINGKAYHNTILATDPSDCHATLTGNSTFSAYTLPSGYVHDTNIKSETYDYFVYDENQKIKPTYGYMLFSPSTAKMPMHISRSGQIVYAGGEASGLEGVPTIGDRSSLMFFGAMGGFELLSLSEQLVTVYNIQGNIIFQKYMTEGEQVYVGTSAGVFVVRGENETIKVLVN